MMKKIAIPVDQNILNPHFGHCSHLALFDTDGQSISGKTIVEAPPHEPGLLPRWLADRGVTDIIAGGMGQSAIRLFGQHKINVFIGAQVKDADGLANDFLTGNLVAGANYCDH